MGIVASGRMGSGKNFTSQMMELDVRALHRRGFFKKALQLPSGLQLEAGNETGSIRVCFTGKQMSIKYFDKGFSAGYEPFCINVNFDWTPCHFGGHRPWFLCPKCGKRVAILYGGKIFIAEFVGTWRTRAKMNHNGVGCAARLI